MKKGILSLAVLAVAFVHSSAAFGAFTIEELLAAGKSAVEDFKKVNASHVEHFVGYKVWKSGEESKAKIYVTHDGMNMEFNYSCHKHDALLECHAQ